MLLDLFGALDPAFTRCDAMIGEWWLIQPVSPRLKHWDLAGRLGLQLAGFLPPSAVDVPGRVIMACYERDTITEAHRVSLLDDSKWIAGYQKVLWAKDRPPLSDPEFDLVGVLEGITEDSYGPFKHSSELPAWPSR